MRQRSRHSNLLVAVVGLAACGTPAPESAADTEESEVAPGPASATELRRYPIRDLEGVLTLSGLTVDEEITSDGDGSLRITAEGPTVVRLYETGDIDVEEAVLFYQARLRVEDLEGVAFLEMWVRVPGVGEAFSRGLEAPLSGTSDWVSVETPFFLQAGQNPDNVKLNLAIEGTGTVWIDDIRLTTGPLPSAP